MDFNRRSADAIINSLVDAACVARNQKQKARNYLGGSRIGHPCSRSLQMEFLNVSKDDGQDFPGRTIRIFDLGHQLETLLIEWLRESGFHLVSEDPETGEQFGWEWGDHIKGHADGVFLSGPSCFQYPALFEAKSSNLKKFKELKAKGLRAANPTYYAQVILYQHFLQLTENPALHITVCKDNCEIYCEAVPYNGKAAQALIEKGDRIIQACMDGELLPAISADPATAFDCKWCSWRLRCAQLPVHGIMG